MARSRLEHRHQTSPGSWDAVPVSVGTHHRRRSWVVLVLFLAVVAAAIAVTGNRAVRTTPATSGGVAAPAFDVRVRVTELAAMDNDGLFGRRPAAADAAVVSEATRLVGDVVADYLDAAFVAPDTRFSDQPLVGLLSDRALAAASGGDRAGLGVLDAAVHKVEPAPVTLAVRVVTSGAEVAFVVVRYDARAWVVTDGGAGLLHQRAQMVFVPAAGGWRADAVDADLTLPVGTEGGNR